MGRRAGIVGFGSMGAEIALMAACAGYEVTAVVRDEKTFAEARQRLGKILRLLARDEKFFAAASLADDAGREAVLARLSSSESLESLAGVSVVVEAVPERLELKESIFRELARICGPEALLATNTSSISITQIAAVVDKPQRVIGLHFFNPVSQMKLVEVIPGLLTSEETIAAGFAFCEELGKKAIRIRETPGFVVNRLLVSLVVEAIRLVEEGIASREDVDEAMKLGAGFPLGPLKLADLVGLDVLLHACESIYSDLGDSKFKPPFMLKQLVRAGRLGRKVRKGFYDY